VRAIAHSLLLVPVEAQQTTRQQAHGKYAVFADWDGVAAGGAGDGHAIRRVEDRVRELVVHASGGHLEPAKPGARFQPGGKPEGVQNFGIAQHAGEFRIRATGALLDFKVGRHTADFLDGVR
jgi:hypothetical protein